MEISNSAVKRLLNETICPVCKKIFYRHDPREWAYWFYDKKGKKRFTCSYSCNKVAKEKLARKSKRRYRQWDI